jgi:hypothetical protein
MTSPFKVVASDVIPIGTVLFVPRVDLVRVVGPDGKIVGEYWDFNPKAGAVLKNVKVEE